MFLLPNLKQIHYIYCINLVFQVLVVYSITGDCLQSVTKITSIHISISKKRKKRFSVQGCFYVWYSTDNTSVLLFTLFNVIEGGWGTKTIGHMLWYINNHQSDQDPPKNVLKNVNLIFLWRL